MSNCSVLVLLHANRRCRKSTTVIEGHGDNVRYTINVAGARGNERVVNPLAFSDEKDDIDDKQAIVLNDELGEYENFDMK